LSPASPDRAAFDPAPDIVPDSSGVRCRSAFGFRRPHCWRRRKAKV